MSTGWLNKIPFAQFCHRPMQGDFPNYLLRSNILLSICVCIYMMLFIRICGVNYAGNTVNDIEKNPGLLIISSLILSNSHLCKRTGN